MNILLTPYSGAERLTLEKSNFNYYLSQLRIRVEMAFGVFVNKWTMFKKPLQTKLEKSAQLFICATKLHNFIINDGEYVPVRDREAAAEYIEEYLPSDSFRTKIVGTSAFREKVCANMAKDGLQRPLHNLERNKDNEYMVAVHTNSIL